MWLHPRPQRSFFFVLQVARACTGLFQPLLQEDRLSLVVPLASLAVPSPADYALKFLQVPARVTCRTPADDALLVFQGPASPEEGVFSTV